MVGDKKSGRHADDFYPTPPEAVAAFLEVEGSVLRSHLRDGEAVWEPACGDGKLAAMIEGYGLPVVGTDLRDRGYGQGGVDFMRLGPGDARSGVIVTNPPFNIAAEFIIQARRMKVRYMALLLKSTYWHAGTRIELWRDWIPAAIYPLAWRVDFTGGGASTMDVSWCVWRSGMPLGGAAIYRPLARPPAGLMFSPFRGVAA